MTRSGGVRAVCGALMAVGVALGESSAGAGDLVGSEEVGGRDAGDVAMATHGDGHRLWSRQPRTSANDSASEVATDKDGNVYVVGGTLGVLGGRNQGGSDAWLIKFDGNGHRLWSRQPGTSTDDSADGVATDRDGNVYVAGSTAGALGGGHQGGEDAWLIKFDARPSAGEPAARNERP